MKNLRLYIVIIIITILNISIAIKGAAQTETSATYGNTFIHHDVEVVIHGYHNFEIGSLQVQQGIVGTERRHPRGYIGFTNTTNFAGASDESHIDGYVRFHGEGNMILPLGDNGVYAPLQTDQKSGTLGSSYFNADPSIAITDVLNGDNYIVLPEGGPFNTSNHGPDISFISDYEYWHIEGDAETKVALYYGYNSELEKLTGGNLENLTIVGWNGSTWNVVASQIVASTLGENLNEGSIKTKDYINPSTYSILTFGSLSNRAVTKGVISGIAWNDYNGDGVKQNNEPPLPKANLYLEECDPTKANISTTTDGEGRYSFDNLEDGFYRIVIAREDLTTGKDITVIPSDNFGEINNDFLRTGTTACLEIKFGAKHNSIDLGLLSLGGIGDFVWEDLNNNGLIDNGEPGISNVSIDLMQGDSLIRTTTSSAAGSYIFQDVYPGNYYLKIDQPLDYDFTSHNLSSNERNSDVDHSNGPSTTYTFEIKSNQLNSDLDIGLSACNILTDYVWIDRDKNDIYNEGDFRKSGVQVNLYKASNTKNILYATTTTDGNGQYEFCVAEGNYYIEFVLPSDGIYEFTNPFVGDNDLADSDVDNSNGTGTTPTFYVNGPETMTGISAGINSEDFVGTMVWLDQNRDGIRQIIEPGIEGITIDLYNSNHQLQFSKTSDADGRLTFKQLQDGTYYLRAQSIEDYEFTIAFAGNDVTIDNNFNEANGKFTSKSFEVLKGHSNPNIDLGLMNDDCLFTPLAYDLRMGIDGVEVIWETNTEINISSYVVEKRIEGTDQYTELKSYKPNGEDHQIYGYLDKQYTNSTTATYRIISYAIDGTVCISQDKSINIPDADVVIDIFNEEDNVIRIDNEVDPCDIAPYKVYHKMRDNKPQIIWLTEDETKVVHYVLQRKLRVSNRYINLDTIVSDNLPDQIYGEIDYSNLIPGNYKYRLVTYGSEGQECFSDIINVNIKDESNLPFVDIDVEEKEEEETVPFISQAEEIYDVLLYPNPATEYTNLQVRLEGISLIEVNIFDTEGKMVMSEVVNGMVNDSKVDFKILLHDLKSGVYFIRTALNDKVVVRKLIKHDTSSSR